jgi:hypothetical protein
LPNLGRLEVLAMDRPAMLRFLTCISVAQAALRGSEAEMTQAVSNMLEILPAGMHKWVGMDVLLKALQLDASQVPSQSVCPRARVP